MSLVTLSPSAFGEILVPRGAGSEWLYLDTAAAPSPGWEKEAADTGGWKAGPAPLGYGEQRLGTVLSFGSDSERKPMTAWFRKAVAIKSLVGIESLGISLCCDDGAVIYLNGKEVGRDNMPPGPVTALSRAVKALSDRDEGNFRVFTIPVSGAGAGPVKEGTNIIAIEVHQVSAASSDLFMDAEVALWKAGEAPTKDLVKEGMALLTGGNLSAAVDVLVKVPSSHPDFRKAMQALASQLSATQEGGMADLEKVYAAAPGIMEVAYAWVRAHVEARTGLTEKVVARKLPAKVPVEFAFILSPTGWRDTSAPVSRKQVLEDLDYLEEMIANCYSYADRTGSNWRGALDAIRSDLPETMGKDTFLVRLNRFMTLFGDPHSAFREAVASRPAGQLDAAFAFHGEQLLAMKRDRSGWLNDDCPCVQAINGVPLEKWIAAATGEVPRASKQFQKHLIARELLMIPALSAEMGKPCGKLIKLTLTSLDGKKTATAETGLARGRGGVDPNKVTTGKSGDLGVLRLEQMDDTSEFIAMIDDAMNSFKETTGLIIDVRGNGGGTQDAIRTVLPYFMQPTDPLKIVNVAAYRLPVKLPMPNPEGFLGLSNRGLHPVTTPIWKDDEKAVIEKFAASWKPLTALPSDKFTGWHYMGIRAATNPRAWQYKKPVVVLQDGECFSATDNFLGALKGHPGVTLMGTPSGGGSGRMARYALPSTGFHLTLCQMASFHFTGFAYDGNGVQPDELVEPTPEDLLIGKNDSQLAAAKQLLAKVAKGPKSDTPSK